MNLYFFLFTFRAGPHLPTLGTETTLVAVAQRWRHDDDVTMDRKNTATILPFLHVEPKCAYFVHIRTLLAETWEQDKLLITV